MTNITKEWLENELKTKNLKTIAKEIGRASTTMSYYVKKFSIIVQPDIPPNTVFEGWTVIKRIKTECKKNRFYICRCKCGEFSKIASTYLIRGRTKQCSKCSKSIKNKKSKIWRGYEEISKTKWSRIIRGAKSRNLKFKITIEYCWDLFVRQNRRCALSNRILTFAESVRECSYTENASLDRIDSNKGYIKGNVQWVHKDINRMKRDIPNNDFILICKEISRHNNDV